MLKKSITFENFNEEMVTEEHYFHLSKADLVELEVSHKGGLSAWIERITKTQDAQALIAEFKKLILSSYGQKSEDGSRFIKNEQLREGFESSPAFEALFMELVTDANAASEFVNGIVPRGLEEEVAKMNRQNPNPKPTHPEVSVPPSKTHPARPASEQDDDETTTENVFDRDATRVLTQAEIIEMDADELKAGLATGRYVIGPQ